MKFLGYETGGFGKPGLFDAESQIRDLSGVIADDAQLLDPRLYIATLLRSATQANSAAPARVTCRTLTRRETGILFMIANGLSNKQIAQSLGIAPETVKSHAKSIFVKLASRTRAQAVARAQAIGIL
jgi:LuxR family maltose regulon positive regulatory protein